MTRNRRAAAYTPPPTLSRDKRYPAGTATPSPPDPCSCATYGWHESIPYPGAADPKCPVHGLHPTTERKNQSIMDPTPSTSSVTQAERFVDRFGDLVDEAGDALADWWQENRDPNTRLALGLRDSLAEVVLRTANLPALWAEMEYLEAELAEQKRINTDSRVARTGGAPGSRARQAEVRLGRRD